MKKRLFTYLTLILITILFITFEGCLAVQDPPNSNPNNPAFQAVEPVVKENVYQITEPGHLLYMAQHPDRSYALADDIDMKGYIWTPIDDFTGSLTGLIAGDFNYTISNLTIAVDQDHENNGFFRILSGTVRDINLQNVSISSSETLSGNIGVIAGVVKTEIIDVDVNDSSIYAPIKDAKIGLLCGQTDGALTLCKVGGTLDLSLEGGSSYIGGGVGASEKSVVSFEVRTNISVTGTKTSGSVGGLTGYTANIVRDSSYIGHMFVSTDNEFSAGTLVGNLAGGSITSGYNCARSCQINGAVAANEFCGTQAPEASLIFCLSRSNENLEELLSDAEYALRKKVVDYAYRMATYRWYPLKTISYSDACGSSHDQIYKAGNVYFGLPYAHLNSSMDKFLSYLDKNNIVVDSVPPTTAGLQMLGNDCADLVYWSWSQVEADITYTLTENAICINGVQAVDGFKVNSVLSTSDICSYNGAKVMYEAYANVQMGDALLFGPGHMRLAAEAAYVFRNQDGTINASKSYIVAHEQGLSLSLLNERHSSCGTYTKYTFAQLFETNYIPVTIDAFKNGHLQWIYHQ